MREHETKLDLVRDWVSHAEHDLDAAIQLLEREEDCPTEIVGFHAQQCVEKYIKALLCHEDIDFPKSHNIHRLFMMLPTAMRSGKFPENERALLTEYATGARYPGWGEISVSEARQAVAIARRVRAAIRRELPMTVKRRRK